jgi:D-alanyl-D-alanine carboxypeptidase
LEVQGNHAFSFKAAGIEIVFNPTEKSFLLKQGGGEFTFVKE